MSRESLQRVISDARRFFTLGRVPRWTIVLLPFTIAFSAALSALPPLFIGNIVDALGRREARQAIFQLGLYMAVTVAFGLVGFVYNYASSIFRETLAKNVQIALLERIDRARLDALGSMTLGQITNRIMADVRQLVNQFEYSIFPMASNLCTLVATFAIMLRLDYRLALTAFVCSFAVVLPLRVASPHIKRLSRNGATRNDDLYSAIAEAASMSGLAAYRNVTASNRKMRRLRELAGEIFRLRVRTVVVSGMTGVGSTLAGMVGPAAVMALGTFLVVRGGLSVGAIVAILIYQSRIAAPLTSLSQLQLTFATMVVTIGRLLEIADLPLESSGSVPFNPGALSFTDVHVSRAGRDILRGVSFRIERGEHVGIIGPSGAGKSSVASLITRYYEPNAGQIRLGDHDLRDYVLAELRCALCLLTQAPFLMDASMRDNIMLNERAPVATGFDKAIEIARLDDVIARSPNGLETVLGQDGFRLSGGERQRICLARAILQEPQILILDEALSGLDVEMERAILEDLRTFFASRTMIVITHRTDSVADFDALIAVEAGLIVAR